MTDEAFLFRDSDHGPDCRCEGGIMYAVEVQAERGATVDELSRMLVDEELVDLATEQVRRGDSDWDMNRVRLWIAMLRVGEVWGSRL
jgi:hypothetical protein